MAAQPGQVGLPCSNATEGRAARGFDPEDGVQDHSVLKKCIVCDMEAGMRCPTCGTWYCGQQCLKEDWRYHSALCKTIKDRFNAIKAPINHVRAILFPVDANKPTWAWIDLGALDISITRALGITAKKPLQKAIYGLQAKDINKGLLHRKIGHGIRRFTAPKAHLANQDGAKINHINKSIFSIARPGCLRVYFGAAIFLAFRTAQTYGVTKIYYQHASPRDLRMILEWYCTRHENPCIPQPFNIAPAAYGGPGEPLAVWQVVKLNCDADTDRLSRLAGEKIPDVELVYVVSRDLFENRVECELATMAGLPWVLQQCHSAFDTTAADADDYKLLFNELGGYLVPQGERRFQLWHRDNEEGWVVPSDLDFWYCGSLLVMRKGGDSISPVAVTSFSEFIKASLGKIKPKATSETEPGNRQVIIDKRDLERVITKQNFESFWHEWISAEYGRYAVLFPSPYDQSIIVDPPPATLTEDEKEDARKKVEEMLLMKFD